MIRHANNCISNDFAGTTCCREIILLKNYFINNLEIARKLIHGVHDTPHAHESHATHIAEAPVLSRPEVRHSASVVGLLIEEPVAIHHMTGLAVRHAVTVHGVVTVIHHLIHLTHEVLPLVDLHSVGSPVL